MATKKSEVAVVEQKDTPVTVQDTKPSGLAAKMLASRGEGMEGTTKESFAIPFLTILQSNSPQLDTIEGAKSGMFFESVNERVIPGTPGLQIILCAYSRRFVRWAPRTQGGGYRGEMYPEEVKQLIDKKLAVEGKGMRLYSVGADSTPDPDKHDMLRDTRNHYILMLNPDTGSCMRAMLSLSSTQIKKSGRIMTALEGIRMPDGKGGMFKPPTFSQIVRLTTVPEANEYGKWFGARMTVEGPLEDEALFDEAKDFRDTVAAGLVTSTYDEAHAPVVEGSGVKGDDIPF